MSHPPRFHIGAFVHIAYCSGWSDIPGNGIGISQPTARWIPGGTGGAPARLAVAVVDVAYRAYVNIFDTGTGIWSGWLDRGGRCDSAVAVHPPLTPGGEFMLVVRGMDGNNDCVNTAGLNWTCLGAP